jgi:hypothetical protein
MRQDAASVLINSARNRNARWLAGVSVESLTAGGKGGIRTLDTHKRILDFESSAFDHSATFPLRVDLAAGYAAKPRSISDKGKGRNSNRKKTGSPS